MKSEKSKLYFVTYFLWHNTWMECDGMGIKSYKWKCWILRKMVLSNVKWTAFSSLWSGVKASKTKSCIKWINQIYEKLLLIEISKTKKTFFFINVCFSSYPLRVATSTTTTTTYSTHSYTLYSWDGSRDLLNPSSTCFTLFFGSRPPP